MFSWIILFHMVCILIIKQHFVSTKNISRSAFWYEKILVEHVGIINTAFYQKTAFLLVLDAVMKMCRDAMDILGRLSAGHGSATHGSSRWSNQPHHTAQLAVKKRCTNHWNPWYLDKCQELYVSQCGNLILMQCHQGEFDGCHCPSNVREKHGVVWEWSSSALESSKRSLHDYWDDHSYITIWYRSSIDMQLLVRKCQQLL